MGIKLGGSSDFDQTLFQLKQGKVGESKVTTEAEFISLLSNDTGKEFVGASGSYHTSERELVNEGDTMDVPSSSPASNFTLTSIRKVVDPEEHEEGEEKYKWTNIAVYFQHKTEYRYDDNIWSNNSRVIYHRRVCYQSTAVPVSDGYVGSETISVEFRFKELIEEEEPIPVNPTMYGAFPSGISADFCVLICKTDEDFARSQSLDTLNEYANAYEQQINPEKPDMNYFGSDEIGPYICLIKETIDESNEIVSDWERLHHDQQFELKNSIITCNIENEQGQIVEVDCYKVYLAGKTQLIALDGENVLDTYGHGSELEAYSFPNGYYLIIGDRLYLFLLTDINAAELDKTEPTWTINFAEGSTLGTANYSYALADRKLPEENNNYYIYEGQSTQHITTIDKNTMMFTPDNVRDVVLSDSITSVGHLINIANPRDLHFPKHLEYLGPFTTNGQSGNVHIYIYADSLKDIADNAIYNNAASNSKVFIANEEEIKILETLENWNGYVGPTNKLRTIGENALKNLKFNYINLTGCRALTNIGKEALAGAADTKQFYFLDTQLSQRRGVSNTNLIYLPDECQININDALPINQYYDESSYTDDITHRTLGTNLNGYNIHIRNQVITLTDLISS